MTDKENLFQSWVDKTATHLDHRPTESPTDWPSVNKEKPMRIEKENEKWMIAFGVDHATSSYLQIWVQPWKEQDCALVIIDNQGVNVTPPEDNLEAALSLPEATQEYLGILRHRFAVAKRAGNTHPNLDAETINLLATQLGFHNLKNEIYAALD